MGAKPLFCPPNNQTRILKFVYLKKINMKESRNRDNNTKKTEYILNERCKFCKKKLSMTKKKIVRNFGENRMELFQDFLSENKFAQNFCPPNICDQHFCPPIFMTSLRRCSLVRNDLLVPRSRTSTSQQCAFASAGP